MTPRPQLDNRSRSARVDTETTALAEQLQTALDTGDADAYDSWFASDIMWGTPKGATVNGYDQLNAIHHRLMAAGVAPASRFEVVSAQSPAPGVVIAQIHRRATDPGGFSEMAMYVLIERDGEWWLAAAQNTPVLDQP